MQGSEPIGLKSLEHSHVLPLPTRWQDWKETIVVGLHNLVKKNISQLFWQMLQL